MKNITVFLSENFKFLEEKFSTCLNRRVFVMRLNDINMKNYHLYGFLKAKISNLDV